VKLSASKEFALFAIREFELESERVPPLHDEPLGFCHHEEDFQSDEGSAVAAIASGVASDRKVPGAKAPVQIRMAGRLPEGQLYQFRQRASGRSRRSEDNLGLVRLRECMPEGVLHPILSRVCLALSCLLLLTAFAAAQNITGTVTNGTTGKPSVGDQVSLLSLSQGMQEIGTSKTDAQGRFSFPAPTDTQAPHMVRVMHQGVGYFPENGPLMPGSTTAQLTVYDSAPKVDGLSQTVEVDRLQSDGKQLEGVTLYAVTNKSEPPRTMASEKGTFEIVLPAGAQLDSAQAKGPGGQPIATEANPGSEKNHYWLKYPLRPGETQFQVSYHMPYSGEASFSPKPLADVQHFVVMMPKSMTFTPKNAQSFQSMQDPQSTIMVATNVKPGQDLSFRVAGSGVFQADNQQGGQAGGGADAGGGAMGGSQAAANDNRPGGGLGAPIDAPDPLHDYRAYILGAFALVLVMGGAFVVSRSNRPQAAAAGMGAIEAQAAPADFAEPAAPRNRQAMLLEAMKEELFQLELDRQQGNITADEYTKAKAALDETIKRAIARSKS
jgi:hypothetical protein